MNDVEERLHRLERDRARFRLVWVPMLLALPVLVMLAGAGLGGKQVNRAGDDTIVDRVVTRSLVIVDEANRPRIDLGIDSTLGTHVFMRDEDGVPLLALTAPRASGSLTVFDRNGHAVAVLTASTAGDGLLRLSDAEGRTMARLGRWIGRDDPGVEFYAQPAGSTVEGTEQGENR